MAYIPIVRNIFKKLNVSQPNIPDIPDELIYFCGRSISYGILNDIHSQDIIKPLFIKPKDIQKLFTGHLVSCYKDLIKTASYDMNLPILISEPMNFLSEYRGFVLNNKLIGLKHYTGDFSLIPDVKIINNAIKSFLNPPVAYSIDFGVTEKGSFLIEINDSFALGNYGLSSLLYTDMIEQRWDEIVGN